METHYDLSPKEAATVVSRQDKRRINLYRKFGKEDYDQPYLYHLVIKSSKQELETASQLIFSLVKM